MSDTVQQLRPAVSPQRDRMLELLDNLRAEIESGHTVGLVLIPIHVGEGFSVRSTGDVSMTRLAGLLGRAWLDATEALKD